MSAEVAPHEEAAGHTGWTPADPGPLGLASFAITTFVLSMFNSGLVADASEPVVLGLTLFVGGIAQLVAGLWEFRTGNTFGAVAFCSYGAFWLAFWAINVFYAKEIKDPAALGHGLGLFLYGWAIFTLIMTIAALRTNVAVLLVFVLLLATFIVLAAEISGGSETKLGGYLGIITALVAWYAAGAGVINGTWGKQVLPVGPLDRS